jgi:hypothetical protein
MANCRECWDDGYIWTHPSGSDDDTPRFEKCDACDVLKDDNEAAAKASGRSYYCVWWHGYVTNENGKPTSSELRHEDITKDNGWDDDDIEEISTLQIGERHTTGGPIEEVTVYRWK